jgi:hypothetical protein
VTEITIASPTLTYVGTIDGKLYVSANGGITFADITPAAALVANWPTRWLSGITIRQGSPPTLFVTFHGTSTLVGSDHVWKGPINSVTGAWLAPPASISSNLPNAPVGALAVDPNALTTLYVATDVGVFRSVDDGVSWQAFDDGLPNVSVIDLAVDAGRQLLRVATHGRGMFQRSLGATCPDADLYVRDNIVDTGERFPSPSNVWDPTRPNERLYHWQSADIKVDAPPFQPVDALVDGVEFDNPTHRLLPFGPGYRIETVAGITHENPVRAQSNRVYVQVHNRGWKAATAVDVRLLWADAGAGLPALPANFWTGFATDSYTQTTWHLIGSKQTIPSLEAGVPRVLQFAWTPPATTSDHVCLLMLVDSPDDPLLPQTLLDVDLLTRSNKRVTHKNVHPVNAGIMGQWIVAVPWFHLYNPSPRARQFTIGLDAHSDGAWSVTMVLPHLELPKPLAECVSGLRPVAVDEKRAATWLTDAETAGVIGPRLLALRDRFRDPLVLQLEPGRRAGYLRGVRLDQAAPLPAVFVAVRDRDRGAGRLRLDVLQRDRDRLLGGSTFLIGDASNP